MNLLLIDTSGPVCSLALARDTQILSEFSVNNGNTHSVNLMPMVDSMLEISGVALENVDVFGAVTGPGSFTGVRLGVATVKALAEALDRPCFGVDALEALAYGARSVSGLLCPILDARARQVYGALFRGSERVMEDDALPLSEYFERVRATGESPYFLGDGILTLRPLIEETFPQARFANPASVHLRAGCAAMLAMEKISAGQPLETHLSLMPMYLRKPQAEREREKKNA